MPTDRELERETIVRWDDTGEKAKLWTASPKTATRWRRAGYPLVEERYHGGSAWSYQLPDKFISFRSEVERPKREMTDEERERARARMERLNERRRNDSAVVPAKV